MVTRRCVRAFRRDESGAILPFVAVASPLFILMLAFTVDMDLGRLTGNKLQISADAAALAAVQQIPNRIQVQSTAVDYARKNYNTDNANTRDITNAANVEMGYWDDTTRTFYPGDDIAGFYGQSWDATNDVFVAATVPLEAEINSVWVRTRRDATNNNPLPSAFASFVGIESFDIKRTSIAVARLMPGDDCLGGGILSDDYTSLSERNELDDFCLYGRNYVELKDRNEVRDGTFAVMEDESDYRFDGTNDRNTYVDRDNQIQSNTGGDWGVGLPSLIGGVSTLMKGGTLPSGIASHFGVTGFVNRGSGDISSNNGSAFASNILHYVDGDVSLDGTHDGMFIVATGDITIEERASLSNAFLVADGEIEVDERANIGSAVACLTGDPVPFNVYLWSGNGFESDERAQYWGTQVVTNGSLEMADRNVGIGFFAEVAGSATLGDRNVFDQCGDGLETKIGDMPEPFQGGMRMAIRN